MTVSKSCRTCKWGRLEGWTPPYVCVRWGMDTYGKPHFPEDVCEHWDGGEPMGGRK